MDSLNAHALASLYKCFPAPEAHSYAKNLEIHYSVICRKMPGYFTRIFITHVFPGRNFLPDGSRSISLRAGH